MAIVTPNMGLTAWDLGDDYYDYSSLANNWVAVDTHDHGPNRGQQIGTPGIKDNAITTPKIVDNAVTAPKIPNNTITQAKLTPNSVGSDEIIDGSVNTADIANGAITLPKIDPNIMPMGAVIAWYRPNSSFSVPPYWAVCDGRAWNDIPNGWYGVQGNIPDLRNRFILGAAEVGTGSDTGSPPSVGLSGGSHTRNLSHTHSIPSHSHGVTDHQHQIIADGAHTHGFVTDVWDTFGNKIGETVTNLNQRTTAVPTASGFRQSAYVPDRNRGAAIADNVNVDMQSKGLHAHGNWTAAAGAATNAVSGQVSGSSLSTAVDTRPQYVGLLYIMKVW
jgi:hypothetical protein